MAHIISADEALRKGLMTIKMDRPVLITGTPRSGKSCIANVLKQAPEFAYLNEPLMIWDAVPRGRADDRLTQRDATPDVIQRIRRDCAAAVQESGRTRYLDNLAHHALAVPFVRQVLPEARIIHIIRDPIDCLPEMIYGWTYRDSVSKAIMRRRKAIRLHALPRQLVRFAANYVRSRVRGRRRTWGPRVPGQRDLVEQVSAAEIAGHQWGQMIQLARTDLHEMPAERWMEVRFEKVIAVPEESFRQIAEFAGVDDVAAIAAYARDFIRADFEFEKKVEPTDVEWSRIWERIGSLSIELGYTQHPLATSSGSP